MNRRGTTALVRGLVLSCHPLPTAAVTTMMAALVTVAGNSASTVLVATLAVLTGQLSIGWSNDALDARRDGAVDRADKPVAQGTVTVTTVWFSAVAALSATVPLSLALGWRSGVVHLVGVACGWLYNVALKSTPLSPLPFFVAFGGLPAVATLTLPDHPWPPVWVLVAGGLVGVAAHFGNVLPDLDQDARTGVQGLPHRIGRQRASAVAMLSGVAASLLVAFAPSGQPSATAWLLLAAALTCAAIGLVLVHRDPHSEAAFGAAMLGAALGVAMIATSHTLG